MEKPTRALPEIPAALPTGSAGQCENCGAPLYGKYCYACGQPVHGLVRHFSSVLADVADSVLNIDERLFRTLAPLYFRPGSLTLDYFAGKRARYVTPFRLVFFIAIITFFVVQLTVRFGFAHYVHVQTSPASLSRPASSASAPAQDDHFANGDITFNDKVLWNRTTHPLQVAWLPDLGNDWLNERIDGLRANMHDFNSGNSAEAMAAARRVTLGLFSAAPTVLFVLLPIFALLLKVFYLFKRRLYMEHLIVAMHSHAFILLSILLLSVLGMLRVWADAHAAWLDLPLTLLRVAASIWIVVYLFLMQKRVYRQGRFMTTLKFLAIGGCYGVLLLAGTLVTAVLSMSGA